jgi:hypothetical protein
MLNDLNDVHGVSAKIIVVLFKKGNAVDWTKFTM